MEETKKKEETSTHKIGIYLWIWGLLFVLSFFSYMVDWYAFQGLLRWSLILIFMFLKAGLISLLYAYLSSLSSVYGNVMHVTVVICLFDKNVLMLDNP